MFGIDQTYLAYELAYRTERLRGERHGEHRHEDHRALTGVRRGRRAARTPGRRAA